MKQTWEAVRRLWETIGLALLILVGGAVLYSLTFLVFNGELPAWK